MRILQLCHKPPYPSDDGGKIAMARMAESLQSLGCEIFQLIITTPTHQILTDAPPFPQEVIYIDTRLKMLPALINLIRGKKSYNLERFVSKPWNDAIRNQIREFKPDIIQAEGIWTIANIERIDFQKTPLILRAHNAEYKIWERKAHSSKGIKKWYLNLLSNRLKKDEFTIINQCHGVICISDNDQELLLQNTSIPSITVSGGTEFIHSKAKYYEKNEPIQLFHLGAMNWGPNQEGMDFFIDTIWPELSSKFSDLKLVLGGKDMPLNYTRLQSKRIYHKPVANAEYFMKENGIMLVPLQSGSGIRIKIMEGLALGIVIMCSKIAAEGIPVTHKKELFICENASDYLETLQELKDNPLLLNEISENARTFAKLHFDSIEAGKRVLTFYKSIKRI